jgi:zinc transport system ATP-binding protein
MSLIRADHVSLAYGRQTVLSDVSLAIEPGEIVTLVGPNGSGKSSLVKVLTGQIRPDAGQVRRKPELRLGYVPQKLAIDQSLPMTVLRFLNLPRRRDPEAIRRAATETGIEGLEQRQVADLSGGQMQRVLLARALLVSPELLILDEPTQGLDQPGEAAFYRHLERLRDSLGCAVFMVSHDLHVVMSASDRVICLNHHVCCEGTPKVVRDAPEYRALFGQGTQGALALYQHDHDHHHHDHEHDHQGHDHA